MRELERLFPRELVVVGVHSPKFPAEKVQANLRAAAQRLDLHHPVVNDHEHAVWGQYAVRAWPTLMFVDPRGRVFGKHEGEFLLEPVRALVAEAVARADAAGLLDRTPLPLDPLPPGGGTLRFPGKVLADPERDRIFVADSGYHRVLVADRDGVVSMVVGSGEEGFADGPAAEARFRQPQGLALAADGGTLYVADLENHAVRAVTLGDGRVTTIAGTGEQARARPVGAQPARETALSSPWDLALVDGALWVAMAGTHQLWALDLGAATIRPAAGSGGESIHDAPLAEATFAQPCGVTVSDRVLYTADSESSAVRLVDPDGNRVRRLVGQGLFAFGDADGTGDRVRLQHPLGVAAVREGDGTAVYIADAYNNRIKRLDPATRTVVTVAGTGQAGHADGPAAAASYWEPGGLGVAGRRVYVADTNNHAVRVLDLDAGSVSTLGITLPGP